MDVQMSQKGCPKVPWALKSILLGNMPTFLQHSNALNRKLETSNFYFFKCMTFLVLKWTFSCKFVLPKLTFNKPTRIFLLKYSLGIVMMMHILRSHYQCLKNWEKYRPKIRIISWKKNCQKITKKLVKLPIYRRNISKR